MQGVSHSLKEDPLPGPPRTQNMQEKPANKTAVWGSFHNIELLCVWHIASSTLKYKVGVECHPVFDVLYLYVVEKVL